MVSLFQWFVKQGKKRTMLQKPTILNIKTVAKSTIFEIQSVDLKFANGTYRTYERFRPGKYASVMVMAIDGEEMLLVREYAMGTERYELGFVKGRMDAGETPEQSANREVQEVRVPLANINELLQDPEFNEAKNLTALYLLRDYLNNH